VIHFVLPVKSHAQNATPAGIELTDAL